MSVCEQHADSNLIKVNRSTIAVTCLRTDIKEGGSMCPLCEQLWNSGPDEDYYFFLDKSQ